MLGLVLYKCGIFFFCFLGVPDDINVHVQIVIRLDIHIMYLQLRFNRHGFTLLQWWDFMKSAYFSLTLFVSYVEVSICLQRTPSGLGLQGTTLTEKLQKP